MSFWASLTTQAVDGMISAARSGRDTVASAKQEDLLLRVLPVLNEALSPTLADVHDLVIAACTIIIVLAAKGYLEDHVLDSLMEAVVLRSTPATVEARFTCLAVLAEQRDALELSKTVTKKLTKNEAFLEQLLSSSSKLPVGRINLGLVLRDLKVKSKSDGYLSTELLAKLLRLNAFTEGQENALCKKMVKLMSDEDKPISDAQRDALTTIMDYFTETSSSQSRLQDALRKAEVSQERIEGALQTTLLLTNGETARDADGDDEMQDVSSTRTDAFADTIATLEKHQLSVSSFLAIDATEDYALFRAAYLQAMTTSEAHLAQLLTVSTITSQDESLSVPIMTLLLRLSSDTSLAQKARATAMRCMHKLVKSKTEPCAHLQFLLPYLVAALADSQSAVRQAAAESILSIAETYKGEHRSKVKSESEVHRDTYPWEVLSHDAMQYLLQNVLVPNLEEASLDGNTIVATVAKALIVPKESKKDKKEKKKSKTPPASEICEYLAFHATGTTLAGTKLALLKMVNGAGVAAVHAQENVLVLALKSTVSVSVQLVDVEKLNSTASKELQAELWRSVTSRGPAGLELLTNVISGQIVGISHDMAACAFKRVAEIWSALSEETGNRIANLLIDGSLRHLDTTEPELYHNLATETIRNIALPGHVLSTLISSLPNALNMPDAPPATKRRRTSRSEKARLSAVEPANLTAALGKYTLILELVEINNPAEHPELLEGLFKVLEELQNFRLQTSSGLVYLQGLAMTCLLAIVDKLKGQDRTKLDMSSIRIDLIVDCIRHSNNAQIQSTALLLISSLATWQPDSIVNSIMPIFTFMGNTILRQSDEYSAHVTEQTISKVVPPLVESFKKKNKDVIVGASSLLLSFTAAFEHIPLHRRLTLFEHLTRTVGADESLYALIAMLTDAYPTDAKAKRFVSDLLNRFEPSTSLKTARKCLDLVWDMYRPRRTIANHILNLSERDKQTHDTVALNLLTSLSDLLKDKRLRSGMSKSFDSGDLDTANAQRTACVELIQEAIRLNGFLKSKNAPELMNAGAEVLSAIVGLLPTMELVQCSETLLAQKDEEVRLVAVGSVLARAREVVNPSSDDVAAVLGFMSPLMGLLKSVASTAIAVQAITCAGQIIKRFGKKDTGVVITAAQVVTGDKALKHADRQIQLSAVVNLTIAVRTLKDEFIPLVPAVLPVVFSYLEQALAKDEEQGKLTSLAISCFAFVQALVEHLPFLVTGDALDTTLQLLGKAAEVPKLKESRGALWRLVAKHVEADEAIAAFERNFEAVAALQSLQVRLTGNVHLDSCAKLYLQALVELFSSLRLVMTSRPKSAIIRNASTLFELFLKAFDQPRTNALSTNEVDLDEEEIEQLQSIYQEVALVMVMKLNDATFRPFIVRLSEWATQLPKKDTSGRTLRATSMFEFLAVLFSKLKGLVTSYATYALDLAAEVLTSTLPSGDEEIELLHAVLSALTESFEHDDEEFWQSPHHFNPIATPLITLLQTSALSPSSTDDDSEDLTPKIQTAILTLAQATSAQDQHRTINTALLKMLRHEDAKVRLAAVKTERELCEKMGDEWVGMLPEMLPFVAEIMEDDDKEVERAGREWVRFLEGVLGENLDLS